MLFSIRSVGLPPVILEKVEAERPSSPILVEAQEFIRADLESSFDNFSKVIYVITIKVLDGVYQSWIQSLKWFKAKTLT